MANDPLISGHVQTLSRLFIKFKYLVVTLVFLIVYTQLHRFRTADTTLQPQGFGLSEGLGPNGFETYEEKLPSHVFSRVGKVTSIYYEKASPISQAYERALLSHKEHDENFGYKHYVQRHGAINKFWSKHAYLIHILVQELNKPVSERLQWLFWHDADIVLLNNKMALEVFLPPEGDKWKNINLVISNDFGGLNDGTFFVRVCEWSVYLFAASLSFPFYRPKVPLRYDEQSALQMVIQYKKYKNKTIHVPQQWFNTYQEFGHDVTIPPEWHFDYPVAKPGDLLVHLAGYPNKVNALGLWLDKVGVMGTEKDKWNIPFSKTTYAKSIPEWWAKQADRENATQTEFWRRYHILHDIGYPLDRKRDQYIKDLKEKLGKNGTAAADIEKAEKAYLKTFARKKMAAFRLEDKMRSNGSHPDNAEVF